MRHNKQPLQVSKQRGNTLVIAVFVIVVLGGLVAALASLLRTTSESVVVEVLGARSYLAAQSGLEQAMMRVYPLERAPVTDCGVDGTSYSFSDNQSLEQCSAVISCDNADESGGNFTHLVITSTGSCRVSNQTTSRRVSIETRVNKEEGAP